MSLLNDVLKDLDQRESAQRSERMLPKNLQAASPAKVRRETMKASALILLTLVLVVLLAWYGWQMFADYSASKTNAPAEDLLLFRTDPNQSPLAAFNEQSLSSPQILTAVDGDAISKTGDVTAVPEPGLSVANPVAGIESGSDGTLQANNSIAPILLREQETEQKQEKEQKQERQQDQQQRQLVNQIQTDSRNQKLSQNRIESQSERLKQHSAHPFPFQSENHDLPEQKDSHGSLVKVNNPELSAVNSKEPVDMQDRTARAVVQAEPVKQELPVKAKAEPPVKAELPVKAKQPVKPEQRVSYWQQAGRQEGNRAEHQEEATTSRMVQQATIKPSTAPEAVANRTLNKARKIYRQGDPRRGEQILRHLLAANSDHSQSQLQLGNWLLARGAYRQVLDLLNNVGSESSPDLRAVKAHALFALGQQQRALALLQNNLPPVAEHSQIHSLRAGLLQQTGQYAEALMVYAELVEVDASQGAWWAGLGISLEQTGRMTSASRAYYQALTDADLGEPLARYAKQRLSSLSSGQTN